MEFRIIKRNTPRSNFIAVPAPIRILLYNCIQWRNHFRPNTQTVLSLEQVLHVFCLHIWRDTYYFHSICSFNCLSIRYKSLYSQLCKSLLIVCCYIEIRISLRQFDRTTYEGVNVFLAQNISSKCLHQKANILIENSKRYDYSLSYNFLVYRNGIFSDLLPLLTYNIQSSILTA